METREQIEREQKLKLPESPSVEESRQSKNMVVTDEQPSLDLEKEFARRWAAVLKEKESQFKEAQQRPADELVEGQQSDSSIDILQETLRNFSLPNDQEQVKRAAALEEAIKKVRG